MKRLLILILFYVQCVAQNKGRESGEGNFALPISQQPISLFGFGQSIVEAHDILVYTSLYYRLGNNKKYIDVFPALVYGVTDRLTVYASVPFVPKYQECNRKSSGIADIFLQAEYLYYTKETDDDALWATVAAALVIPTGSANKCIPTGAGGSSFFLGTTLMYWSAQWYWVIAPFTYLTTQNSRTKFGNEFFYHGAVGRNLVGNPEGWIVTPMIELLGAHWQRDRIKGRVNCDSGGNVLYIGPSLWTSTNRFTGQVGVLFAVWQKLNGHQNKDKYLLGINVGWKFNA